jgi:hypothetical protein
LRVTRRALADCAARSMSCRTRVTREPNRPLECLEHTLLLPTPVPALRQLAQQIRIARIELRKPSSFAARSTCGFDIHRPSATIERANSTSTPSQQPTTA